MLKGLIVFGTGMYVGVYIAQNYQIDKVENPRVLIQNITEKVKDKIEELRKDK